MQNSEESEPRTQFMVSRFPHCSWKNENLVTSVTTNQKSTEQDYCKVLQKTHDCNQLLRTRALAPSTGANILSQKCFPDTAVPSLFHKVKHEIMEALKKGG
ncbi:hypothetical protein AMECASPLE_019292 [Ameca splendens]|uniref:Uncharacterized protein n=1 Tax=Ameca splendens TaxID=208324 RepID=A0ABV0ZYQ2_9TELE